MHTRRHSLGETGLRAFIILLIIYVACFTVGSLSPLSSPPASCEPMWPIMSGNKTVVDKPVEPVIIDEGQIPVGATWIYIYKLQADHTYHIYLLGDWADLAEHNTDYDIYVYEISGATAKFVSSHTESAGLPEQVGNDGYGRYFTPSRTGNYYFCVANDRSESSAAEVGTFIAIEHIDLNHWYSRRMQGKVDEEPVRETTWAYEFNTSADRIRVFVDVPSNLDMYEARLYVMAKPAAGKGALLNGIPVAWEPGLRGERSGFYGGFNFDPQGFRHVDAMGSCEHSGEDMVIDYEAPAEGNLLYHLVLIAEYFSGTVKFIVQTDFESPELQLIDPLTIVESGEQTVLEVSVRDETAVESLSLSYSTDGGGRWRQLTLIEEGDGVYSGEVPALGGGTMVDYVFEAEDEMGNVGEIRGSYKVMSSSDLELHLNEDEITGGESVKTYGYLTHGGKEVEIHYTHGNDVSNFTVTTDGPGYFSHVFTPDSKGEWQVAARFAGDNASHPAISETLSFAVTSLSTSLTCTLSDGEIELGEEVTISGAFSLEKAGLRVELTLAVAENTTKLSVETSSDGSYSATFKPDSKGAWKVRAGVQGDGFTYEGSESATAELTVVAPSLKTKVYRLPSVLVRPPYLYGLLGVIGGTAGGVVFYIRRRE